MKLKPLPIFLAFFVMGVADAMGPLADAVKVRYHLTNVMATLLTFFVFIAFALFSVPGGVLSARIGRKKVLLLGLAINSLAILLPSVLEPGFPLLLGCIFLLGVGTTLLQVAGNPIMRDVSAEGRYARNLSFAQFIKGVGSSSSSYLVGLVAMLPLFSSMGWRGAFPVFLALMLVALALVMGLQVEERKVDAPPGILGSLSLLKSPACALAVLGIFLYVGAEVCMARFLKPTLAGFGLAPDRATLLGPTLFFGGLTVGRLLGTGILTFLSARAFFRVSAALGALGSLALLTGSGALAVAGVVACGLGFANIWPLLFSITVEDRPERASELSGLMCMAISGGAILPLLMGGLADHGFRSLAFAVPLAAFAFLVLLSLRGAPRSAEA
jgi:fucose permease